MADGRLPTDKPSSRAGQSLTTELDGHHDAVPRPPPRRLSRSTQQWASATEGILNIGDPQASISPAPRLPPGAAETFIRSAEGDSSRP